MWPRIFDGSGRRAFAAVLLTGILANAAQAQVQYVRNDGQWDDRIAFKAELSGGYMFAERNSLTYVISEADRLLHAHGDHGLPGKDPEMPETLGQFAYRVHLVGANPPEAISGRRAFGHYHNYFTHREPARWRSSVPVFGEVYYESVYDGIDLRLHSRGDLPEYDFVVHPGADPSRIALEYEGIGKLEIHEGSLRFHTPLGYVTEMAPVAWQESGGERREIPVSFRLISDREVGFALPESYDKSRALVIDPVLVFATYTGSLSDNWGFTATYDRHGNLYAGGMVSGNGYPTTIGAYDTIYNGGTSNVRTDIAISKFSADGSQLLYSTYIGGSANEIPHSIIVNDRDELVIYGTTGSANYPVTANAWDVSFNGGPPAFPFSNINYPDGSDIVITKLNAQGTNLLGSTFFGGNNIDGLNLSGRQRLEFNYGDFARGDVAIAENFDILIASCSYSDGLATPGSFGAAHSGGLDGLVARFNDDLSQLVWATYVGGSTDDATSSIELWNGEVVLGGGTTSADMAGLTGFADNFAGGQADGFLLKITDDGTAATGGTFLGTSAYDQVYFVETDRQGNLYAFGQTLGSYPVSAGVYSANNATQFIHKFSPDLETSLFSTVFGSPWANGVTRRVNISPTAFLVDNCNNIYAIGWGGSVNQGYNPTVSSTSGMQLSADAFQSTTDGSDFYFIVLEENAESLLYATYFGELGGRGDHLDGGTSRFDKDGFVYHASCASCGGTDGFPTTPGAWSETNNSSNCNIGLFKFAFDFAPIRANTVADPIAGCPPLEVQFQNTSNFPGEYYFWDFGDGSTSTEEEPQHIFTEPGVYDVQFIIVDSSNCLIADTTFIQITVTGAENVTAAFEADQTACVRNNLTFTNLSESATVYLWDFGDGTTSSEENPVHSYNGPGTYTVTLYADPGSNCGDTATAVIQVANTDVLAGFTYAQADCGDTTGTITFTDISSAQADIDQWSWDFGDGGSSGQPNPVYSYGQGGSFDVVLTVTDVNGCSDFASAQVIVSTDVLEADFQAIPNCDPLGAGVQFLDASGGSGTVVSWFWDFGDANTSNQANPLHFYGAEGSYTVTLWATNDLGCTDSITRVVDVFAEDISVNFTFGPLACNDPVTAFVNNTQADSVVAWLWDFGDGTTSAEENPVHEYNATGTYLVTLTATTASGCEANFSAQVSHPRLGVDFSFNPAGNCDNLNVPILFSVTGFSSSTLTGYTWDFGDGTVLNNVFVTFHTFTEPGDYTVVFTAVNQQGCTDTVIKDIFIRDEVGAIIESAQTACSPDDLTVVFSAVADIPEPIAQITWNFGDGGSASGSAQVNHTYADTGTYVVTVDFTTSGGCTGAATSLVTVVLDSAQLAFEARTEGCRFGTVLFDNQSTAGGSPIEDWNWDFGDGQSSDAEEPAHTFADAGTYTVTLTATSQAGCVFTEQQEIDVFLPQTSLPDATVCAGDSVRLELETNYGASFLWSPAATLSDAAVQQPLAFPTSTTLYAVTISDQAANGDTCYVYDSVQVTVLSAGSVTASATPSVTEPGATVDLSASAGFESYTWSPAEWVSDPFSANTQAEVTEDAIFLVTAIAENGCPATDTVLVRVIEPDECRLESLFIPNAFSPNGDGLNDRFNFVVEGSYDRVEFRVLDRWGTEVFRAEGNNISWDGTFNGDLLSGDAYGYDLLLECNGETKYVKGNITLVR